MVIPIRVFMESWNKNKLIAFRQIKKNKLLNSESTLLSFAIVFPIFIKIHVLYQVHFIPWVTLPLENSLQSLWSKIYLRNFNYKSKELISQSANAGHIHIGLSCPYAHSDHFFLERDKKSCDYSRMICLFFHQSVKSWFPLHR